MATWPSGKAEDCKSFTPSSNLGVAFLSALQVQGTFFIIGVVCLSRRKFKKYKAKKNNKKPLIFLSLIVLFSLIFAWTSTRDNSFNILINNKEPRQYIQSMAPLAQYYGKRYGLFPSVILAQSAIESDFGRSELSRRYHNYFGIKQTGNEAGVNFATQEYINGQYITIYTGFKKYNSAEESVADYAKLLSKAPRYEQVLNAKKPQEAASALVSCGYATDPKYAEKIINVINEYRLNEYD